MKDRRSKKVKRPHKDDVVENAKLYDHMSDYEYSGSEEDLEGKRIRLAKGILQKAKEQQQKEEESFFSGEFRGVEQQEEGINAILQTELMKKRDLLKRPVFEGWQEKWDTRRTLELKGHKNTINCMQLDKLQDNLVYTAGKDMAIICWDLEK